MSAVATKLMSALGVDVRTGSVFISVYRGSVRSASMTVSVHHLFKMGVKNIKVQKGPEYTVEVLSWEAPF